MKKQVFALAAVAMIAGTVTFTSCAKEDTVAPVITVTGGNTITQNLPASSGGGTWTNPTATATDDEDGTITAINVSGTVNPNLAGTYTLTYTCSDAAGNTATETVTVNVINEAQFFDGAYNSDDTCQVSPVAPYTNDIIVSTTVNRAMVINNFGGFGNTVNINATMGTGTTFTVPTPQTIGTLGSLLTVNGSFTQTPVSVTMIYGWNDGVSTETCTSIMNHQ
jgi:Domain of unknown function (DUF5011)